MTYDRLFRHVLTRIEPERSHRLGLLALRSAMAVAPIYRATVRRLAGDLPSLRVRALGLEFPSPLGVAAGFDKDGTSYRALTALGFGFVEVGTVTARAQPGNSRPRIHRLPLDRGLANSMGFPSSGARAVARRLRSSQRQAPVGVNIGKSRAVDVADAAGDYRAAVRCLGADADYLVLNVSSPNTPGLRDMQSPKNLGVLVREVRSELASHHRHVPLLVKIDPDLRDAEIDEIADSAMHLGLDGIVAVNTTVALDALSYSTGGELEVDLGGVSGVPLKRRALEVLRRLHARCGESLTLVSVGGIETPEDAWERILAGATLVQAYSGFVYGGPLWPRRMNEGLARCTAAEGYECIEAAIGGRRAESHLTTSRPAAGAHLVAR